MTSPPQPQPPPQPPPLVVGIARPQALAALAARSLAERPADMIEARLDLALPERGGAAPLPDAGVVDFQPFLTACGALEQTGTPVLVTVRRVPDGGRWVGDGDRLPLFEAALAVASWVDVEVESTLAGAVVAGARARGRTVVVSHHDFSGTPALEALEAIVDRAASAGADIVKVATRVATLADHDTLLELMRRRRGQQALSVIGMGPLGTSLRTYLPCVGSRLAYGFLDEAVVPGQLSAAALVERLRADCPAYAARRRPPHG